MFDIIGHKEIIFKHICKNGYFFEKLCYNIMSMKFIEMNKALKEKICPLYNIIGDDFFLIRQAIINLKNRLVTDLEEFNYSNLDAEKLKKEQVNEQILMMPMVSDYRLLVLQNPNSEIVKFLNTFDFDGIATIVVCIRAEHLASAETIDCNKLERADINKYVLNQLKKHNLSIQEQALDLMVESSNLNMSKLVNELSKITAYCVDDDIITTDVVVNLVTSADDYAIYMLSNAIDNKDYITYQKILYSLTKSQTQNEIFSYLGKYFKRMYYISLSKNDDELAKILNIKPYAVKMSRANVNKNGIKYYLNLYKKYVELDYKIKSGKITAINALYELIF